MRGRGLLQGGKLNGQVLLIVQVVTNVATVVAILFGFWQVRIATIQLRKQNDKSATEFVLNSEGQFDGMYSTLMSQSASVIRCCFPDEVDPVWSDDDLKKYVFYLRYYGHISRMVYLVRDDTLDIGMKRDERDKFLAPWEARLAIFRADPIMRRIHENAVKYKNYNEHMLRLSRRVFDAA
jgi:hypothetical protein